MGRVADEPAIEMRPNVSIDPLSEARQRPAADEITVAPFLERRRQMVADTWNLEREVVLIGAGEPIHVPGRGDLTYPFQSHSEYLYLTDRERPFGVLAFDPCEGWIDFVASVSEHERLWEGATDAPTEGVPLAKLPDWLATRRGRPAACLGAATIGVASVPALEAELRSRLNALRRPKDELELTRMRVAERATRAGFAAVGPLIEAGLTERALQIEIEASFFRSGGNRTAFDTIVASGANSAVLHFAPSARRLRDGELVLIDAGAEYRGYACDVTRTYPVSGTMTPTQAEIHQIVRAAGIAATRRCTAGTEWREVHRTASLVVAEGLIGLGLLRGNPASLVEQHAVGLFFPHGVGHMLGLGVRDAGEVLPGRSAGDGATPRLRVDLPLDIGYVVTIEPGIYFVPSILSDAQTRARYSRCVKWDRVDQISQFGGIRIEDNVLVTADGPEVLTADIPLLAS